MPEPSAASGEEPPTDERPEAEERPGADAGRRSRLWWAAWLVPGYAISYGLVLPALGDRFWWLGIPGMVGLACVVLIALNVLLEGPFRGAVPYATDGTDRRGPVRHHCKVLVGRYLLLVAVGVPMVVVPLAVDVRYLYPFVGTGLMALLLGTRFWLPQILALRKCARVLKVYDFEFRSPVKKSNLRGNGVRSLTLGAGDSPRMSAREPLCSDRWPRGIEHGVWFAGDDPFGGVLLVPDTGELMCMQPENWAAQDKARRQAAHKRRERARQAGLARKSI
ncbi:hypothetical protein BKA00_004370 [Actinomadura coerulea]|uniref:Uncharacterized protein n=1 Tax=Actinomadura coerulea TaxID=46159 RepID=A0A7X0L0D4_9ACTN|nr:hypothetical protein [Actinomadura coerulea]MBB6397456.1 hypothetical protein [Actinomadura coerulea]GGQ02723.1 hypothetical protein GCM10010187_18220 [Actinomadura coerulea]